MSAVMPPVTLSRTTSVARRRRKRPAFRRLDAAPLVRAIELWEPTMTLAQERAYFRARRLGTVTVGTADALCCSVLGTHPALIFGEAWWTVEIRP
ncbi:hypothetical protein [Janibacter melonis]|uniref:hypothetical protein n=1 Tax=Janibacter melonis TaxID=262209 RepID=UPI00178041CF|nr:hypothetical protein [Janibacter melonis]